MLFPIKTDCCGTGLNNCSILANGNVSPCPSFQGYEFTAGNIKERSFIDIWNDPKKFPQHNSIDVNTLNDVCGSCAVRLFCGGGCRAQAFYASNGDIYARSPRCKEFKKLYIGLMWLLDEYPNLRELRTSQSASLFEK